MQNTLHIPEALQEELQREEFDMQTVGLIFLVLSISLCISMMFALCFTYGEYKACTPKNAIKL